MEFLHKLVHPDIDNECERQREDEDWSHIEVKNVAMKPSKKDVLH